MGGDICPKCSVMSSLILGEWGDSDGEFDEYECKGCGFRWPCKFIRNRDDVLPAQVAEHRVLQVEG
jgi:Zn ribbon nucleic-acid-binding protein